MKNTLRTGAIVALVIVVVGALLGAYALNGNLSSIYKNSSGDATNVQLNEGGGLSEGSATGSSDADGASGEPDHTPPDQTPGPGNNQLEKIVSWLHMRFPSVMAVGVTDRFEFMAYTLDSDPTNLTAYTGDLVVIVEVTPSEGSHFTDPSVQDGGSWFTLSFDQPGDYTVTVTPYDSSGNVIGDPYEGTVKVRTLGSIVSFETHANKEGDYTYFLTGLRLMQIGVDWNPPTAVSKFVLTIDGESYDMGNQGFRGEGYWGGIFRLPNSDYTPGAVYTVTAYDNNGQVLATTSGIAPS